MRSPADEGERLSVVFTHVDPREHCRKFRFAVEVQADSSYAGAPPLGYWWMLVWAAGLAGHGLV